VVARGRAVLLVANAAAPYSRALRVARSLAGEGWNVEIAAVLEGDAPAEEHDGAILIRRYAPSGPMDRLLRALPRHDRGTRFRRMAARGLDLVAKGLLWPLGPRGWWATLRRELSDADLYHAFGILAIPVALDLAAAARTRGRDPLVAYDVIDAILDSNNYDGVPAPVLAWYRRREARWVRRSDAVVTVNDALADHCARIWPFRERPTVLLNCQPRRDPPPDRPDHIRRAAGLSPARRVVLFLGRLGRDRGLEAAAEAVVRLDDAALVMLGFPLHASWAAELDARSRDPRFAGRHVVLPPVHPDEVPDWAASADVSIIAVAASSLNQRLSTPNKFWESLAAGTPVVIGRDLEVMRAIVEADGLGAVADPDDPDDLARALREVLDQSSEAMAAMRARCLRVCRERYNWETAVEPYLALVARLADGRPASAHR
jgi:glycosyltransferase involved in cell wall biosynthesis